MLQRELGSNDTKNKMAVKSTFRSSNPSESFRSTTFQFCLEKVCLALQKFHKAQTTNTPPTHRRRISYVIKLNSGQRVGRQSIDCWPTCGPTRRWDRILNFYPCWLHFEDQGSGYLLSENLFYCNSFRCWALLGRGMFSHCSHVS